MAFDLSYKPFGERAILIEWKAVIDTEILNDMMRFKNEIETNDIKSIVELKYAYNSLLVVYNYFSINFEKEVQWLKNVYKYAKKTNDKLSVLWKIPVCYDTVFGIDLETLAHKKNISKATLIKRHTQTIYTVYFIGFLPGFLYLGGLEESLFTPRKATPRLQIEKGAVAIGGNQTGVYPTESPGGWNIIGNTPVAFFNAKLTPPCFAKTGDQMVFQSVSLAEYQRIKILVNAGHYLIENETVHG